jgi:hypothetical protein
LRICDGLKHHDLGTALLEKLEARGIRWHPILRSNAWNPHPVWFGVYGGIIYHHGAGFRRSLSLRVLERTERRPLPAWVPLGAQASPPSRRLAHAADVRANTTRRDCAGAVGGHGNVVELPRAVPPAR